MLDATLNGPPLRMLWTTAKVRRRTADRARAARTAREECHALYGERLPLDGYRSSELIRGMLDCPVVEKEKCVGRPAVGGSLAKYDCLNRAVGRGAESSTKAEDVIARRAARACGERRTVESSRSSPVGRPVLMAGPRRGLVIVIDTELDHREESWIQQCNSAVKD